MYQTNNRGARLINNENEENNQNYENIQGIEGNIDDIFDLEENHIDKEKENGDYYIGTYSYSNNTMLMANSVSIHSFYKYSYSCLYNYLSMYSIIPAFRSRLDIMQLCVLPDQSYSVVLKTYWLRIIQRTWKRVYSERRRILMTRMLSHHYFEIHGDYPVGLRNLPHLRGMLCSHH